MLRGREKEEKERRKYKMFTFWLAFSHCGTKHYHSRDIHPSGGAHSIDCGLSSSEQILDDNIAYIGLDMLSHTTYF